MKEFVLEIITQIIKAIFLDRGLFGISEKSEKYTSSIINIGICLLLHFILSNGNFKWYILQSIFVLIYWIVVGYLKGMEIHIVIPRVSLLLTIYEFVIVISSILGTIASAFLPDIFQQENSKYIVMILISTILKIVLVCSISYMIRVNINMYQELIVKKYILVLVYLFVICIKIPFLYTEIGDARILKMVFLTIICCTVVFLIISKIDKRNAEKERAKIEENNKKLSTKLHKSQEILPAMVQVLSNVTENGGTEMEEQDARKLLEEVNDLYGQQLKENSKEDLQLKNFCSTGLRLLDEQLKVYQMEALDRNVNLDIFVQAPINDLIKKDDIDQLKLQRAVGDLIRNAFHAMESEGKKCRARGQILLIIGCQYENILEVAVVDNGAAFPLHVIEAFGSRGVTTGGTGNGLADLAEFADETQASIRVDEFAWETSSFTKKVSIIFDKQRVNYFNSSRRGLVGSSFWNTQ